MGKEKMYSMPGDDPQEELMKMLGMRQNVNPNTGVPNMSDESQAQALPDNMAAAALSPKKAARTKMPIAPAPGMVAQPPQTGMPALQEKSDFSNIADQYMQMLQSPERKAQLAELAQTSKDYIGKQGSGIDKNQEILDQLRAQGSQANLQPLLAYTDATTGSHFADSYKQPKTPQETQEDMLKLSDLISKERQGLSTDQTTYLKDMLSAQSDPLKQLAIAARINQGGERIAQGERRLGITGDKAAAAAVDSTNKEGTIEQISKSQYRVGNDIRTLGGTTPIYASTIKEIESGLAAALSGSGIASDSAREAMHIPQAMDALANLQQKYGNTTVDLRGLEPDKLKALSETLQRVNAALAQAKVQRSSEMQTGKDYAHIPQAKKALGDLSSKFSDDAKTAKEQMLQGEDLQAYQHAKQNPKNPESGPILKSLKDKYGFDF